MKYFLLILAIFVSISSYEQSLKQRLMRADSDLKDVRIIPFKGNPELFIAILVTEDHWWETMTVGQLKNHRIMWKATFDTLPDAQSIYAARQIYLKGFPDPMIEVFDITHMGNGDYYLYCLHGHNATLLLRTKAVDRNRDGAEKVGDSLECSLVFRNDSLTPSYADINHDGFADVCITGVAMIYAQDDKTPLRKWNVREVFLYNKRRHQFVEDRQLRMGDQPWH